MAEHPKPNNTKPSEGVRQTFGAFIESAYTFFHDLIDLKNGLDKEGTIVNIKNNKKMKGANAWLLMCSILIASLGLDLNSPAVIIGAMLISPLMSPILGIGLSVGINDSTTLKVSSQHLLIAIVIALVTSTLYFLFTGIIGIGGGFTNEISGRTSPNMLDASVALVGGFAGIISSSRKDKSNAIPGVAIATALMPPLCVTGFGIANMLRFGFVEGDLNYLNITWNSFFLFFLNATLVALATYLIVRSLNFPFKAHKDSGEDARTRMVMFGVAIFMIGMSLLTTWGSISDNREKKAIHKFVEETFESVLYADVSKNMENDQMDIKVSMLAKMSDDSIPIYNQILRDRYKVQNPNLQFVALPDLNQNELQGTTEAIVLNMLQKKEQEKIVEDKRLDSLRLIISDLRSKKKLESEVEAEALLLFPELEAIDFYKPDSTDTSNNPPAATLKWNRKLTRIPSRLKAEEDRLKKWMIIRCKIKELEISRKVE